jgi:cytochrome c-type biogenesis protein CcmF
MHVAHIGIAVCVVGITMVKGYESEKDVRMTLGDTVEVGGYTLRLTGISQIPGPNYNADRGSVELLKGDKLLRVLNPEKRTYFSSTMPMTEAAIDSGPTRDVYVSLGERLEGGGTPAWAMRVYYKPFVTWIWLGCFMMAIGGGMAMLDKRYQKKVAAKLNLNQLKGAVA